MGLGVLGQELDRLSVCGNRRVEIAFFSKHDAQIDLRRRETQARRRP